jgi:hypothetical protein
VNVGVVEEVRERERGQGQSGRESSSPIWPFIDFTLSPSTTIYNYG